MKYNLKHIITFPYRYLKAIVAFDDDTFNLSQGGLIDNPKPKTPPPKPPFTKDLLESDYKHDPKLGLEYKNIQLQLELQKAHMEIEFLNDLLHTANSHIKYLNNLLGRPE